MHMHTHCLSLLLSLSLSLHSPSLTDMHPITLYNLTPVIKAKKRLLLKIQTCLWGRSVWHSLFHHGFCLSLIPQPRISQIATGIILAHTLNNCLFWFILSIPSRLPSPNCSHCEFTGSIGGISLVQDRSGWFSSSPTGGSTPLCPRCQALGRSHPHLHPASLAPVGVRSMTVWVISSVEITAHFLFYSGQK